MIDDFDYSEWSDIYLLKWVKYSIKDLRLMAT